MISLRVLRETQAAASKKVSGFWLFVVDRPFVNLILRDYISFFFNNSTVVIVLFRDQSDYFRLRLKLIKLVSIKLIHRKIFTG